MTESYNSILINYYKYQIILESNEIKIIVIHFFINEFANSKQNKLLAVVIIFTKKLTNQSDHTLSKDFYTLWTSI